MSRTAATGRSGSSADLPSRPDRPRQEIGLHKQNQTPAFPAGFPRRVFLPPQCLQGGRTCRAGEVVGRPMVAPTFIAGTAIKFVGAGIAARLSQSSPHLVGADALMPSEEGCSIPFPPGRRKLHIRSLLLPFQTGTISLGSGLADKWGLSPKATGGVSIFQEKKEGRAKPELQTVPPSRQKKPAPFRFRRGGENSISAAFFFLPKL